MGNRLLRCSAVVLLALAMLACSRTPPEQQLRDTLGRMHDAMEARDPAQLQSFLADDFIGPKSLDRDGARRMAQLMFLRYRDVGVNLGPVTVDMKDGHATARFSAALTGGTGAALPDSARLYDVETGWREEDGEWRLTSARWAAKL